MAPEDLFKRLSSDPVITAAGRVALKTGSRIYAVGGLLRNMLIGAPNDRDYDFIVAGDAKAMAAGFAAESDGSPFALDEDSWRVVAGKGWNADFSCLKGGGIEQDLLQRDFTINAVAVDVLDVLENPRPAVIDPSGGVADASQGLIRTVSAMAFDVDPLRVLRAFRLSQQYGLGIDDDTLTLISEKACLVPRVSAERIRDELLLVFLLPGTAMVLGEMKSRGVLYALLPELMPMEPAGVLGHSLDTVEEAESFLCGLGPGRLRDFFDGSSAGLKRPVVLKLAAFFHDIGKPLTVGDAGFAGHDALGAEMVKSVLKRMRFSRSAVSEVSNLVRNHLRPYALARLHEPLARARAHFFRALEEQGSEGAGLILLCLAAADARAWRGAEDERLCSVMEDMADFYFDHYSVKRPRPILDGREIMEAFSVGEGVMVGRIMAEIEDAACEGRINTGEEAVAYIKEWLKGRA